MTMLLCLCFFNTQVLRCRFDVLFQNTTLLRVQLSFVPPVFYNVPRNHSFFFFFFFFLLQIIHSISQKMREKNKNVPNLHPGLIQTPT